MASTACTTRRLSKGLSGVIGVALTFAIGYGVLTIVRVSRRRRTGIDVSGNHHLYVPGASPLHRLAPQCKLAATVLFVLAVVATPREAFARVRALRAHPRRADAARSDPAHVRACAGS